MNLINLAASLMDGADDVTLVTSEHNGIVEMLKSDGTDWEYLRGMVELIVNALGLRMDDRDIIIEHILDRADVTVTRKEAPR